MAGYRKNKLLTAFDTIRQVENWWSAFHLRLFEKPPRPVLLRLRSGTCAVCRSGTRDWDIFQEIFFVGAYRRAMAFLEAQPGAPVVLDLGGNIGLFSLLAASAHKSCTVLAYEPGPPNHTLFEINRLLNPANGERIFLHREAVAGTDREADWFFNETNPGGSSLFGEGGEPYRVKVRAFSQLLSSREIEPALVKMDIEGCEYELLACTPPEVWRRVGAVVMEIHDDPSGRSSPDDILKMFRGWNFEVEREDAGCYFLQRLP